MGGREGVIVRLPSWYMSSSVKAKDVGEEGRRSYTFNSTINEHKKIF